MGTRASGTTAYRALLAKQMCVGTTEKTGWVNEDLGDGVSLEL
jgi:hypothetical protein